MKYELPFYRHLASMTFRCLGFYSFSLHNYEKAGSSLKLKGFYSDWQELSKREITDKIIAKKILEIQKSDLLDYMWDILYLSNWNNKTLYLLIRRSKKWFFFLSNAYLISTSWTDNWDHSAAAEMPINRCFIYFSFQTFIFSFIFFLSIRLATLQREE